MAGDSIYKYAIDFKIPQPVSIYLKFSIFLFLDLEPLFMKIQSTLELHNSVLIYITVLDFLYIRVY